MPYITKDRRFVIEPLYEEQVPDTAGELNFVLTWVIKRYMEHKGLSYATINDIIGALEGAKTEFYRRVVVPYEDQKIKENGDVY